MPGREFDEHSYALAAKTEMERARPGDWNHAKRVAEWVKKIGKDREHLPLLITAAYIHDIGWRDVLPSGKKITFDELLAFEPQANENSDPYAREFLKSQDFSDEEISTVISFIKAADAHESHTDDEAVIVDADNLSKLNIDHLKEKYQPTEWTKMYEMWLEEFPSRINTEYARSLLPSLFKELQEHITS